MLQLLLACICFAATACSGAPRIDLELPGATMQLLLSTTDDWDSSAATLRRYQRTAHGWQPIGGAIAARVGRNGLGWGLGLHAGGATGPQKREGDGRAPAGIFALGPAFGYADAPPDGLVMPYRVATARDYFVDASESADYNQWQHIPADQPNEPDKRWPSHERMRRDDGLYEFGLVVGHNSPEVVPGRGSAIFLHVWGGPDVATAGCTAMARDDLLAVLTWLRPAAQPLLQVPRAELARLRCR